MDSVQLSSEVTDIARQLHEAHEVSERAAQNTINALNAKRTNLRTFVKRELVALGVPASEIDSGLWELDVKTGLATKKA